ncbi:MAG: DNA translocase FtsK [Gemmatimonadales bacterium]|nr:MAG: DNA translocase FtsK [Gemmatimonadales bacterium]
MVKPEQRSEMAGVALLVTSLVLLLALFPVELLGRTAASWFPSGNVIGAVGRGLQYALWSAFGLGAGILPVATALGGLLAGGWMKRETAIRTGAFALGLLVIVPSALFLLPAGPAWSGWLGSLVGAPLASALGVVGGSLALVAGFALLSVATLNWNPLRAPARWILAGSRTGARSLGERLAILREERAVARAQAQAEREAEASAAAVTGVAGEGEEGFGDGRGGAVPHAATADPFGDPASPDPALEPAHDLAPGVSPEAGARPVGGGATEKRRGGAGDQLDLLPDPRDPRELVGGDLPGLDLLTQPSRRGRQGMERELDALGEVLVEKLRTFNVESHIGGRTTGPVVTQYEVVPAPGVKVNRIANLDADLALAMKARTIRIVAPIPGKGAVGVEIPNPTSEVVQLTEILRDDAFTRTRADLPLALGKDLHGAAYVADLAKMPHALIAGATGSGKSVCLNTVITSLVFRHTPETLRLLLIDPKMVELSTYADLPHLRHPVVTDPKDAAGVLKWAVLEMERRYTLLKENGVRSLGEFNQRVRKGQVMRRVEPLGEEGDPDRWIYDDGVLPFIVLVVDELADLMMSVQSEVEKPLTLLAQKARAIGIHLIVATQRPSVNVITGLIKANFPCRIAFRVASKTDSRTILDQNGADALLGNGDMLFLPPGQSAPLRVQGAYISTEDTDRMMGWFRDLRTRKLEEGDAATLKRQEEDILELVRAAEAEGGGGDEDDGFGGDWDESFREAAEVCISSGQGSTSLLQRKLRIGYGRAARIMDQLHDAGVLGPPDGSKPREVLMSMDQLGRMMSGGE